MSGPDLFFDSSALLAGIISDRGAARALLLLADAGLLTVIVSEQVIAETERAMARRVPRALMAYREAMRSTGLRIVRNPSPGETEAHEDVTAHPADVPTVVAAMKAGVDYVVTLNRRHLVDDPGVAARSGLRIGTPEGALTWVREQLEQEDR